MKQQNITRDTLRQVRTESSSFTKESSYNSSSPKKSCIYLTKLIYSTTFVDVGKLTIFENPLSFDVNSDICPESERNGCSEQAHGHANSVPF